MNNPSPRIYFRNERQDCVVKQWKIKAAGYLKLAHLGYGILTESPGCSGLVFYKFRLKEGQIRIVG